jgi:hypothetical protein
MLRRGDITRAIYFIPSPRFPSFKQKIESNESEIKDRKVSESVDADSHEATTSRRR